MIHVVAILTTLPGQREAVLTEFRAILPTVHAEEGCIEYVPVIDVAGTNDQFGADTFVVIEKWSSLETLGRMRRRRTCGIRGEGGADDGEPGGARAGGLLSRYGLEIRAATEADAVGLSELLGSVVTAERIASVRRSGGLLVAMEWGPPSGVVAVHWFGSLEHDEPVARVSTLLVAPDARRRGIGRLLVKRRLRRRGWRDVGCWRWWGRSSVRFVGRRGLFGTGSGLCGD